MTDLTQRNKDYSVFLPSISTFYNNVLSKYRAQGAEFIPDERIPAGFEKGIDGMDFLKEDSYFA